MDSRAPQADRPVAPLIIADVDGVVTDRFAVRDDEALELLARKVADGWMLGLVTGRSRPWLEREILWALRARLGPGAAGAVTVACEFGAVLGSAEAATVLDERGPHVPRDVRDQLRALLDGPLAPILEWDATKACLACVEVRHDAARVVGAAAADAALDEYARLADPIARAAVCESRRSTFAVDVVPRGLSKHAGTRAVLDRLGGRPTHVLVIGDSESDVEMAEEAASSLGVPVTFAWVGETPPPGPQTGFRVVAGAAFGAGTVEVVHLFGRDLETASQASAAPQRRVVRTRRA